MGVFCLVKLAAFVACSGEDESPPDPLATRAGFCEAWAHHACNPEVVQACAATSVEACQEEQNQFCIDRVPAAAYTPSLGEACLDAVRAAVSDARLSPSEVDTMLRGGGACSFECVMIGDDECVVPTVAGGGEECADPATVCAEGFYCDGTNCLANRREDASCSESVPCASGLKCVGDAGAQVCEAKAGQGEACADETDCVSGICTVPAGETQGICAGEIILSPAEPTCARFR